MKRNNKGNTTKYLLVFDKFIYGSFETIKCLQYFQRYFDWGMGEFNRKEREFHCT
jgi:hypothetical protein